MVTCKHAASGCDYPAGECAGACASAQHTTGRMTQQGFIIRTAENLGAFADTQNMARRLAACWNACDGISTEALEDDAPRKLLEDRDRLLAQRDELLRMLRMARTQLASSLQELTSCHTSPATGLVDEAEVLLVIESEQDLIDQIDEVIAKAGDAA